jgi:ABC-type sugar transport system substrate-binding protein
VVCVVLTAGCGSGAGNAGTGTSAIAAASVDVQSNGPGVKTARAVGGGVLYTYDLVKASNPKKPMTLYYLQVHEDDPGALSVRDTITADARSLPNVTFKYFAAGGYDKPDVQLNQLELAVSDPSTKAIILWSVDPKVNAPLVEKALDKGIAVVAFLEPLSDPRVTNNIYDDTVGIARRITDAIIAQMGGHGKIATILGISGSTTHRNFVRGSKESIAAHSGVTQVAQKEYVGVDPAVTQQLTDGVLAQNPDLGGVLCVVGQESQGVTRSLASAGLKGKVVVGSWAITGTADVELISSGQQRLALGLPFVYWAHVAVRDAVAAAEGNQVPRWQAPPGNLYTSNNILMADLTMDLLPKYLGKYSHPTK